MTANDLKPVVDTLTERLNTTNKLLETANKALEELKGEHKELRAEHKKLQQDHHAHQLKTTEESTRLKAEVEELKKSKDLWGNRVFTLVMCLASALIGGVVTSLVKKP